MHSERLVKWVKGGECICGNDNDKEYHMFVNWVIGVNVYKWGECICGNDNGKGNHLLVYF